MILRFGYVSFSPILIYTRFRFNVGTLICSDFFRAAALCDRIPAEPAWPAYGGSAIPDLICLVAREKNRRPPKADAAAAVHGRFGTGIHG